MRNCRDIHGRILWKKTLLAKLDRMRRPLVDEYGDLLRGWLRQIGLPVRNELKKIKKLYLTHDVDHFWVKHNLRTAANTIANRIITGKNFSLKDIKECIDISGEYSFEFLRQQDKRALERLGRDKCAIVYFVKGGGEDVLDDGYYKDRKWVERFLENVSKNDVIIGLHASYSAGKDTFLITKEKSYLESVLGRKIFWNRNHYLRSCEPEDMAELVDVGITDDFTMGYAGMVGFRLGTSRCVCWINPKTRRVTDLILHPLTIMEGTLSVDMHLGEEEALDVMTEMVEQTSLHGGEISLLWHNTSVVKNDGSYNRRLYTKTIEKVINYMD